MSWVNEVSAEIRSRRIDPMVDYAFKVLLGTEENKDVLIFFLNSVLKRSGEQVIVEVTLINPYNDKAFSDDKLTVVDVKARDARGHTYQLEVQLVVHPFLPCRMLYVWSQLYGKQLSEGDAFWTLKPVTSIWLVRGTVFDSVDDYAHTAKFQDAETGVVLDNESAICILEVNKWARSGQVKDARDEWLKFMSEARKMDLETLAETLSADFVRAVEALRPIREREADYWHYQARLDYLRVQATMKAALENTQEELTRKNQLVEEQAKALASKEQALASIEQELASKEQELASKEQELAALRALLKKTHTPATP